jgi:protein N-terminal methyltransferase
MADGVDDEENWVDDTDKFYSDAKEYWSNIAPNVDGMLGGFEQISPTDINGSKAFLRPFLKVCHL